MSLEFRLDMVIRVKKAARRHVCHDHASLPMWLKVVGLSTSRQGLASSKRVSHSAGGVRFQVRRVREERSSSRASAKRQRGISCEVLVAVIGHDQRQDWQDLQDFVRSLNSGTFFL
jgi:hypothetical protein